MAKKQKKEPKLSPSKQKIIANYENQKQQFAEKGYREQNEIISVVMANIMAFVTAGPFVVLGIILWVVTKKQGTISGGLYSTVLFLIIFFACIFIHEVLHGVGWSMWTQKRWESIYLGVMWEYLTPYCHCKEPLKPRQYLVGGLTPFVVLGIGMYIAAYITGSYMLLALSLVNILCAGGDTTIACMLLKYQKKNEECYILDHPTDCGFVAFVKDKEE